MKVLLDIPDWIIEDTRKELDCFGTGIEDEELYNSDDTININSEPFLEFLTSMLESAYFNRDLHLRLTNFLYTYENRKFPPKK